MSAHREAPRSADAPAPPPDHAGVLLWRQFGATLDMLANAIRACPQARWGERPGPHEFGYLVYHTLFWLDYYLAESREGFAPPPPFNLDEMDPAGLYPERMYTQAEMLDYLEHGRRRLRAALAGWSPARAAEPRPGCPVETRGELLLYSMRHVQHHVGQLQWMLRQAGAEPPRWVRATAHPLEA